MVRVALLGAGRWGPNLLRTLVAQPACEVTWVADVDARRAQAVSLLCPSARFASDPDAVLSAPDVDAVVVATPSATHAPLARRALEAGKHVLVEKPVATRLADALALDELAHRRGLTLMVGHVYLFHPAVQAVKDELASGRLGDVRALRFERTNLGPVREDVDAAWDLAAHDLSIAREWLGEVPVALSAQGAQVLRAGRADSVAATLRYASGRVAQLFVSWLEPTKTRRATVVGSGGMLRFEEAGGAATVLRFERGVDAGVVREGPEVSVPFEPAEPLTREVEHFLGCVRTGVRPRSDGARAADVVRVLEAMSRSMAAGGAETTV
ncbi:MAG: Gfo/Idh/MocA family oxidoreductase [Myxococcota bacterium]